MIEPECLLSRSIKLFGLPNRRNKLLEEMGELQASLFHYEQGKISLEELRVEFLDVALLLFQVGSYYFDDENEFNRLFHDRLSKLEEALENHEKNSNN